MVTVVIQDGPARSLGSSHFFNHHVISRLNGAIATKWFPMILHLQHVFTVIFPDFKLSNDPSLSGSYSCLSSHFHPLVWHLMSQP
jgi:hypothetical protein